MKNKNLSGGLFAHKPTPLTIKETPLSAQIVDWLNNRGIYNDRLQCGQFQTPSGNWMRGAKIGTPDRFAIVCGQIIFVEVKKFGGQLTTEQKARHEALQDSGALVVVADSFDKFVNQLTAIRAAIEQREKEMLQ